MTYRLTFSVKDVYFSFTTATYAPEAAELYNTT